MEIEMIEVRLNENKIDEIFSDMPSHLERLDDDVIWLGFGHGDDLRAFLIVIADSGRLVVREQE